MTRLSDYLAQAAARKAKRAEKAAELWKKCGKGSSVAQVESKAFGPSGHLGDSNKRPRATSNRLKGHKRPAGQRKRLIAQLDQLMSLLVRKRDIKAFGVCRICRKRPIECAYHCIPRQHYATRWKLENVIGACHACNFGERMHRLAYREKNMEAIGAVVYLTLEKMAKEKSHYSIADLLFLRDDLKKQLGAI